MRERLRLTMPPSPKVYIAGVGYSTSASKKSSKEASLASAISAATKALLDAGVTYDDITHGVASTSSKHLLNAFKAFEDGGVAMNQVKQSSELESSFALIEGQGVQSVLMIAEEEVCRSSLLSERNLTRHSSPPRLPSYWSQMPFSGIELT